MNRSHHRSRGKSACQENCPFGPVWAPKSTKSSPNASTSWKFCCDCRSTCFCLPGLRRLWFPFFRTAHTRRITRKWKNFLPNIFQTKAVKTRLNSSVASHLVLYYKSRQQQVNQSRSKTNFPFFFCFKWLNLAFEREKLMSRTAIVDITKLRNSHTISQVIKNSMKFFFGWKTLKF